MNQPTSTKIKQKQLENLPNPQNFIPGYTKPQLQREVKRARSFSFLHSKGSSTKQTTSHNGHNQDISRKTAIMSTSLPALSVASPSITETQLLPLINPKLNDEIHATDRNEVRRVKSFLTANSTKRQESPLLPKKILKKEFPSQYMQLSSLEQIQNLQNTSTDL